MTRRYEIGTIDGENFAADTISNDPSLTTFDTIQDAIAEIENVIAHAIEMWGQPMTNGAIRDSERGGIVWRQQ